MNVERITLPMTSLRKLPREHRKPILFLQLPIIKNSFLNREQWVIIEITTTSTRLQLLNQISNPYRIFPRITNIRFGKPSQNTIRKGDVLPTLHTPLTIPIDQDNILMEGAFLNQRHREFTGRIYLEDQTIISLPGFTNRLTPGEPEELKGNIFITLCGSMPQRFSLRPRTSSSADTRSLRQMPSSICSSLSEVWETRVSGIS